MLDFVGHTDCVDGVARVFQRLRSQFGCGRGVGSTICQKQHDGLNVGWATVASDVLVLLKRLGQLQARVRACSACAFNLNPFFLRVLGFIGLVSARVACARQRARLSTHMCARGKNGTAKGMRAVLERFWDGKQNVPHTRGNAYGL